MTFLVPIYGEVAERKSRLGEDRLDNSNKQFGKCRLFFCRLFL